MTQPTPSNFARKLGKEFVVTVEVHPPRGFDASRTFQKLKELLATTHIDAFNATDSPLAQSRMSAVAMATMIQRDLGTEALMHVATSFRNLPALVGDLLGAHALGVRNVLVFKGDSPQTGDFPSSTSVSDVTSSGLVRLISNANTGQELDGVALDHPTSFTSGVIFSPEKAHWGQERASLDRKVSAGADFIVTQAVFDPESIERARNLLGGFPLPVVMGVLPLRSARHANFLESNVPGFVIPKYAHEAMRSAAPDDEISTGVRLARELIDSVYSNVCGVYLIPAFGRYQTVTDVLSGLPEWSPTQ
jgi:5,10-methylenetetrahydrofolate reductase